MIVAPALLRGSRSQADEPTRPVAATVTGVASLGLWVGLSQAELLAQF